MNITYLAPLQGHTDYVFRKACSEVFPGIDAFFIPYISVKNEQVLKKYMAEIAPENNPQKRVVPQVLVKDEKEIVFLAKMLYDFGFNEVNLNLGCPYPMVTRRGKGAGLLPKPDQIQKILDAFHRHSPLKLSVKMRAGLEDKKEIENVLPVLNDFPLTEIILHPRVAKQLYAGEIIETAFLFAEERTRHKLIYNGDIFSVSDFREKQAKFTQTPGWMLGRGILMNPFLPAEINGILFSPEEKRNKLIDFHQIIFENTQRKMDNSGNALNKMKVFWSYFSYNFQNQKKALKAIKKTNSLSVYQAETSRLLNENIM